MEKKLLTIIIPGYNVADFIVDTLQEVFNQRETNFEVIYVDDASNDNLYMYNCTNVHSLTRKSSSYSNDDILLWWERETAQYKTLINDCIDLNCKNECQPFLAKKLSDVAVRFDILSKRINGHIFDDVILKDSLYPVIKKYIWRSRLDNYLTSFVIRLKLVIKKILK